ncbi:hypothetical protein ACQUSR_11300 [Streptomyces sp. P1-3]|uniref:hypothetical protein n=1 Tax=Streptomyces sp. P1-3 TaxID=3421658 RepID=UPI003D35AD79
MAVLMEIEYPGVTAEQYDDLTGLIGTRSGQRIAGLLSHAAIVTDEGLRVVDVWESPEAMEAFLPKLRPAQESLGFPPPTAPPRLSPVHAFFPA